MKSVRARAPGRVNIIGEHTDYNGGFVMPCAIASGTTVRGAIRSDLVVDVRTSGDRRVCYNLTNMPWKPEHVWGDYVAGILIELHNAGVPLPGADLYISGNVPIGAGLSSSASLEVAVALAMLAVAGVEMQPTELALLAQRAESEFVGMRCGIMDQFAVLHARAGAALFLDTRSLEYELIDLPAGAAIVVCNTMVKHSLASSAYNERRRECEEGVRIIREREAAIESLRDVTTDMLEASKDVLPANVFARCRHVITENARVERAVQALRGGDLELMGSLMYASHESLRVDYEVSCTELDVMVQLAKNYDGTIGARMTGGGFGGCTVNLVDASAAEGFRSHMRDAYEKATGITPEIYDGTPSAGASVKYE